MKIRSVSAFVRPETEIRVGGATLCTNIGEISLFFDESERGLQKVQELINTLDMMVDSYRMETGLPIHPEFHAEAEL